jgi:hypothetical protein
MTTDERDRPDEYAGGEVGSHHRRVNRWLLAVYAALALWAVYYVIAYWGGLGPGLVR